MPFVVTSLDLEIIILSEVSQKDEEKYHVTYIWNLKYEKYIYLTYLQNRNRVMDIESKVIVTRKERRQRKDKSGVWDQHIQTTMYKIDK